MSSINSNYQNDYAQNNFNQSFQVSENNKTEEKESATSSNQKISQAVARSPFIPKKLPPYPSHLWLPLLWLPLK